MTRLCALLGVFVYLLVPLRVSAISKSDLESIIKGTPFYDPNGCSNQSASSGGSSGTVSGNSALWKTGSWNSGIQPPYILEQMMIEVLKDIGQKKNIPVADIVTEQHVIAMVGFAMGEGGDINNTSSIFNPFNNGIDAPDLVTGAHAGDGTQSFVSFDAGVEANARRFVEPGYSRLIDVLSKPASTAQDFMYALTYFQQYPGNVIWAEGSDPKYKNQGQAGQDAYYRSKLGITNDAARHWDTQAALIIGTPAKEQVTRQYSPDKLQFHPATSTFTGSLSFGSSGSSCGSTSTATMPTSIVQAAILYSWPDKHSPALEAKPEYTAALKQFNPSAPYGGADCGSFVGTVMHATNSDLNYPLFGTSQQEKYVRSHPEKYDVLDAITNTSELQPGDILIINQGSGTGALGHTWIYLGVQVGGMDRADASGGDRMPNLGKSYFNDQRGQYLRARLK